jgi:endo-1,4-beta-xylanase
VLMWKAMWIAVGMMTTVAAAEADQRAALPEKEADAISLAPSTFSLVGAEQHLGAVEIVGVSGQPFDEALRVITHSAPGREWNLQVIAPTAAAIEAGDVLLARFWLRCKKSMTGEGFTTLVFELARPDYDKVAEFRVGAGNQWREVHVPFRAPRDYAPGEAQICFRAGFDRQTVDIGGIELINYGQSVEVSDLPRTSISYAGRDSNAPWRAEALERIERIRKGDLTVRVTDAQGAALAGAQVHIVQRRHAFGFGSAVTAEHLTADTPDAVRYRQIVEQYFNTAVFENDMKWPPNYERINPRVDPALDWLLERGIRVRGHNLIWPSWKWSPRPLREHENNPEELRRRTYARVTEAVSHYRGRIVHWDVVNEPYSERDLLEILGDEVMVEWFKLAKAADPECLMFLNDFGIFGGTSRNEHREHFHQTIQFLRDNGAPIDGIGIQSHFGSILPSPMNLLEVLDRFSEFGLPIESTELSIDLDGRDVQADYMRDYLTAVFSHPGVNGIMLWGFWEGRHWRPGAALFERDWTLRPVGQAWIELVHGEWKTDEQLEADARGIAPARGFLGDYEVTVTMGDRSRNARVRHEADGTSIEVRLD